VVDLSLERSWTVTDEQALLARARRLEPEALAEVHERYYPMLYFYILGRVGEAPVAEDLVGEVFLRLLEALHRGRGPDRHLAAWMFRVADHLVADHHRNRHRRPTVPLEEAWMGPIQEEAPDVVLRQRVREALEALTSEQRAVILLRFWAGMSPEEIARELGKTPGAVRALQHRALMTLARRLRAALDQGDLP